jgi:hypothetical protein
MYLKILIIIIHLTKLTFAQLNETNATTTTPLLTIITTTTTTTTTTIKMIYSLKLLNLNYLETNRIMKFNWSTNLTTILNYYFECNFNDSIQIKKTIDEGLTQTTTYNLNIPLNVSGI